jgi:predicted ATP-grasp superfamily ATP-dependent carboligase
MSIRHAGRWHYEAITRDGKVVWRVGDEDDDPVITVLTEHEARDIVRRHNQRIAADRPATWRE